MFSYLRVYIPFEEENPQQFTQLQKRAEEILDGSNAATKPDIPGGMKVEYVRQDFFSSVHPWYNSTPKSRKVDTYDLDDKQYRLLMEVHECSGETILVIIPTLIPKE